MRLGCWNEKGLDTKQKQTMIMVTVIFSGMKNKGQGIEIKGNILLLHYGMDKIT